MKTYGHFGYNDFILCLGYKGRMIKQFFMEYEWDTFDFTMNLRSKEHNWHKTHTTENWNITFADTGLETQTGGRIAKIKKYVGNDDFLLTYGDGIGDVNIEKLMEFHKQKGKMVTITCVHPQSKFGIIRPEDEDGKVSFVEKPPLNDWISGGFMVCKPEFIDLLDDTMFEQTVLPKLGEQGQLAIYHHDGWWHAMDTYKDYLDLNKMWDAGNVPWKVWDE